MFYALLTTGEHEDKLIKDKVRNKNNSESEIRKLPCSSEMSEDQTEQQGITEEDKEGEDKIVGEEGEEQTNT